jgi:hypothetical protein
MKRVLSHGSTHLMTTIRMQTFIVAGKTWKTHNAIQIHQKKHIYPLPLPIAHSSTCPALSDRKVLSLNQSNVRREASNPISNLRSKILSQSLSIIICKDPIVDGNHQNQLSSTSYQHHFNSPDPKTPIGGQRLCIYSHLYGRS